MNLLLTLLLLPLTLLADEPYSVPPQKAKIEKLVGRAEYRGKPLKEGDLLTKDGKLVTKEKSFVKLFLETWNSAVVIGPSTSMEIHITSPRSAEPKRFQLREGICRWVNKTKSKEWKGSHVFTKSAAMGVRGTDFWVKNTEASGETEIIVFDGEVLFQSQQAKSEVLLHKGQWGGVGGKFGKNVTRPKDLTEAAMNDVKKSLAL